MSQPPRAALIDPASPADHPARAEGAALHRLLAGLDAGARGAAQDEPSPQPFDADAPLISALIRTQGRRNHTLVDLLTALAAQTDDDFEALIVGHQVALADRPALERVVEDAPGFLRRRIRLHYLEGGGRARPLNFGFAQARGRYVAIIDDDDIPFAHWVETYRRLHEKTPGRVLRAVTARQNVVTVAVNGQAGLRAIGTIERLYPPSFDAVAHLIGNESPTTTLAFPRAAFRDLGLRFDESLTTAEDWDFLLRISAICGVASSDQVAGLYRWWQGGEECSQTAHGPEEWRDNYLRILRKQDDLALIADGPILARIRDRAQAAVRIDEEIARARVESRRDAQQQIETLHQELQSAHAEMQRAHREIQSINEEAWRAQDQFRRLNDQFRLRDDEFRRLERHSQELGQQLAEARTRAADAEQELARSRAIELDWRRNAQAALPDDEAAAAFGARLAPVLPPDLARAMRKGLRAKLFWMTFGVLLHVANPSKRRELRARRRRYRQFLRHFIAASARS